MIREQNGTLFFLSLGALLQSSAKRPANCKQIGKAAGTGRARLLRKQSGLHPPLIFQLQSAEAGIWAVGNGVFQMMDVFRGWMGRTRIHEQLASRPLTVSLTRV